MCPCLSDATTLASTPHMKQEVTTRCTLYLQPLLPLMIMVCLKSSSPDMLRTGRAQRCSQSPRNDKKPTSENSRNAKVIAGLSQRQPRDDSSLWVFCRFLPRMGAIVTNSRPSRRVINGAVTWARSSRCHFHPLSRHSSLIPTSEQLRVRQR